MKNNKYFIIAFLVAMLMAMQGANAGAGYKAYNTAYDSQNITRAYVYVQYGYTSNTVYGFLNLPHQVIGDDFVPYGQQFEAYIQYGLEPLAEWNADNPRNQIDYCNFIIKETHFSVSFNDNNTVGIISYTANRTFTVSDTSVTKNQYIQFIKFFPLDYAEAYFDCHFIGNQTITLPVELKIITPTWNCKACQYYNSLVNNFDAIVSDAVQDFTNQIGEAIISFITFNIELLGIAFWIALILLLISVVGFGFLLLFWVYLFIKYLIRRFG